MTLIQEVSVHHTADVSPQATIGDGTKIWHQSQIREGVWIGNNCIIGKGAYVDFDVEIGNNVKIQNYASIYHGATIEDGVFIGPMACLTNDKKPRAINPDGTLKTDDDWDEGKVLVKYGASIGAGAIILPNVQIGEFALIGAGAVVTKDVPDQAIVLGNPARFAGYVCKCGHHLTQKNEQHGHWFCPSCLDSYHV